jgi:hypothetical protein
MNRFMSGLRQVRRTMLGSKAAALLCLIVALLFYAVLVAHEARIAAY